jgi:hypothetical protein
MARTAPFVAQYALDIWDRMAMYDAMEATIIMDPDDVLLAIMALAASCAVKLTPLTFTVANRSKSFSVVSRKLMSRLMPAQATHMSRAPPKSQEKAVNPSSKLDNEETSTL